MVSCKMRRKKQTLSATPAQILHPILHPKLSVNTGHLVPWCRKCRRFSKTFFVEGERGSVPESAKHRTSLAESTDVLPQMYGCFALKVRMFSSKNSIKKSPLEGKDIMSECTSQTMSCFFLVKWMPPRLVRFSNLGQSMQPLPARDDAPAAIIRRFRPEGIHPQRVRVKLTNEGTPSFACIFILYPPNVSSLLAHHEARNTVRNTQYAPIADFSICNGGVLYAYPAQKEQCQGRMDIRRWHGA